MSLLSDDEPYAVENEPLSQNRLRHHGPSKREMRQWAIIGFSGVALVGASFVFDQLWHASTEATPHTWGRFFLATVLPYGTEHLGVVLIVACLVGIGVERAREKHFLNAIDESLEDARSKVLEILRPVKQQVAKLQEDLGLAIRNLKILDESSIKELTQKVLDPEFIRSEYFLMIDLEPYPLHASPVEFVKVSIDTSYLVENIKKEPLPYTVVGWVDAFEDDWLPSEFPKAHFKKLIFGLEEKRHELSRRPLDMDAAVQTNNNGALQIAYTLEDKVAPKTKHFVGIQAEQIMRSSDIFVWNMGKLTKSLRANITLSDALVAANFKVSAREMHHHDGLFVVSQENPFVWEIQQVLLPYQGIEIWWSPMLNRNQGGASASGPSPKA